MLLCQEVPHPRQGRPPCRVIHMQDGGREQERGQFAKVHTPWRIAGHSPGQPDCTQSGAHRQTWLGFFSRIVSSTLIRACGVRHGVKVAIWFWLPAKRARAP